jgi:hypothetical protein
MEELKRYFLDRRLGRGIIRVVSDVNGCIFVNLEFQTTEAGLRRVQLKASPQCVESHAEIGNDLLYKMGRIAIFQVQLCVQNKAIFLAHRKLDCLIQPWNGDLTEVPYGGATLGCTTPKEPRAAKRFKRVVLTDPGNPKR